MATEANKKRGIQLLSMVEKGNLEGVQQLLQPSSNGGSDGFVPTNIDAQYDYHHRTPLQLAIERGHLAIVQLLIGRGANLEARDGCGWSCLQIAVIYNHLSILKILLRQTSRELVNRPGDQEETPLNSAASRGHEEMVKLLLEYNADVNTTDYVGRTPLHGAARRGKASIARLLLEHGADVNAKDVYGFRPLHFAISHGDDDEIIQVLMEYKAEIHSKTTDGRSPIHEAAGRGKTTTLRLLLSHGAIINVKDKEGLTPLHYAVRSNPNSNNNCEMIQFLLKCQPSLIDMVDRQGISALYRAVIDGRHNVIQLLLQHGANITAENGEGLTPLRCAISHDKTGKTIQALLECRPDLIKIESNDFDLLDEAARSQNLNAIRLLLKHGVDVNARNPDGYTFLRHLVTLYSVDNVIRLLLKSGAEVDATSGCDGQTPLHRAVKCNKPHAVELLLEYGADLNASDKHGYTPLHFATQFDEQSDVIEALLRQIGRPRKRMGRS